MDADCQGTGSEARLSGPGPDSSPKPLGPSPFLWGLVPWLQVVREKLQRRTAAATLAQRPQSRSAQAYLDVPPAA